MLASMHNVCAGCSGSPAQEHTEGTLHCDASGGTNKAYQLGKSIRCSSMLCEVRVIFILVWILLAAHEQHVLQVMAEPLCRETCMPGKGKASTSYDKVYSEGSPVPAAGQDP